jgi:hypothetical protein
VTQLSLITSELLSKWPWQLWKLEAQLIVIGRASVVNLGVALSANGHEVGGQFIEYAYVSHVVDFSGGSLSAHLAEVIRVLEYVFSLRPPDRRGEVPRVGGASIKGFKFRHAHCSQ